MFVYYCERSGVTFASGAKTATATDVIQTLLESLFHLVLGNKNLLGCHVTLTQFFIHEVTPPVKMPMFFDTFWQLVSKRMEIAK